MSEPQKPTIDTAIQLFSAHREEWKCVLDFITETREGYLSQFGTAPDPNRVMSLSGGIGACDFLMQNLIPESWEAELPKKVAKKAAKKRGRPSKN